MPRLNIFPNWNTNPYVNMLYLEPRTRNWRVEGVSYLSGFMKALDTMKHPDVVHIQWTKPFLADVSSQKQYEDRMNEITGALSSAKGRGVKILWTVHNVIAHDTDPIGREVALANLLVALSDRVIILNSHTLSVTSEFYDIPAEKVTVLPHPSYLGVYPTRVSREEVAARLGLPAGLRTMGFIGAIHPYKGVGDFLQAASLVARRNDRCAVILAGDTKPEGMREVDENVPHHLPVIRYHTRIPDADIALGTCACDVLVRPYRRILNSGSMMLAATLGVPVVLPRLDHLVAEYQSQPWVVFFDNPDSEELRPAAIAAAVETAWSQPLVRRRAAVDFARSYTPFDMSRDFADLLDAL